MLEEELIIKIIGKLSLIVKPVDFDQFRRGDVMEVDVVEIAQEIYRAAKRLNKSGDKLFSLAREYAEAEQEYRKALGVEIMKLREQKVPVSIVGDVARANVAEIKFNRDLAEFRYKAGRDKAQALQAEISALQTLYKRQEDV
ncbi:hypothetical protein [Clostridium cochlearium]|uniref:hypothetical protein n=2 Tax=Clostridium cochlearium TaxID=1494 RepID=UPI001FA8855E|nr:hypothetical protein [Clostridium cochlearium]